jgi:GTP-binding protein YchF
MMKLGITGLSGSGKTTVFEALTGSHQDSGHSMDARIGTIRVPDLRIDALSEMYQPKKTIYAQVEYYLPGKSARQKESGGEGGWTQVRDCDALIHVIRNFSGYGLEPPTPEADATALDQELIISDLVVVEKRLERLENDRQRGKAVNPEEKPLLEACRDMLEAERPLRLDPELAAAPALRGFAFLSAKPMLLLLNNADEDDDMPEAKDPAFTGAGLVIKGKLEQELSQMSPGEAEEFLAEFNITASATDRVIQRSYDLMGLMSFFTVGEDEVRAWTIKNDTDALDAAEVIHSDIKKGFIRAEVVSYDALMSAGSYAEARKQGTVRLEGKTYPMKDGDIVNFRFNV